MVQRQLIVGSELSRLGRVVWLAGALLLGFASQWCITYGACAAPLL